MLDIKNLKITTHGDRKLINGLSFHLSKNDKIAIIGEEGNGKSTILKAIACPEEVNKYAKIEGEINTFGNKIGYVEQILSTDWSDETVQDFMLKKGPKDEPNYDMFSNFGAILKQFDKLSLSDCVLEQKISTLSGGEKIKIQFAKMLAENPDVILLDEPTNDLDMSSLNFMKNFIKESQKPVIFISHDEDLLRDAANGIIHVEQLKKKMENKVTFEHMPYTEYVQKRKTNFEKQTQVALKERADDRERMERWARIYNRVDHEQEVISRGDPGGARLLKKKMKSVKAQERRFEKQRENFTEIPDVEENVSVNFGMAQIPNGKTIIDLSLDKLTVANKVLAKNLSLKVTGPEKIAIIGDNGAGKSTYLARLFEILQNKADIKTGFMPQDYDKFFKGYNTVLDFIFQNAKDKESRTKMQTFLGCLKFTKDEMNAKISDISGGQKAKLYLALLMTGENSVILLDEPTRNLSPLTSPVIRKAIISFGGAVIFVSHDKLLIEECATRIIKLTKNGFEKISNL